MARLGVRALFVGAVLLATSPAGFGRTDATGARCLTPPRAVIATIKGSLKAKARGKLGKARAVKSSARFTSPRGLRKGVYFISAKVRGFGVATWAANVEQYRTGGGLLIDVGAVARRVSIAGIDIPRATLAASGLTERTAGYAESRRCVR